MRLISKISVFHQVLIDVPMDGIAESCKLGRAIIMLINSPFPTVFTDGYMIFRIAKVGFNSRRVVTAELRGGFNLQKVVTHSPTII